MSIWRNRTVAALALGSVAVAGSAIAYTLTQGRRPYRPDSAPGRARRRRLGAYAVVGRTVTINKPRPELYGFWRDFKNLPAFMENIDEVKLSGPNSAIWTIRAPGGVTVDVETEIVDERENELIAWRSVEGSDIETEGHVAFRDAPHGRGTEVEAVIAYKPPAGELGRVVAKLFQREPRVQGRHELKRFKMLMETGEVATSRNRRIET